MRRIHLPLAALVYLSTLHSGAVLKGTGEVQAVEAKIETLAGESVSGELVGLDANGLTVRVGEKDRTIPVLDLRSMQTDNKPIDDPESTILLTLRDGSSIPARKFTQKDGTTHVGHASLGSFSFPARSLAHVLLKRQNEGSDIAKQWAELLKAPAQADMVVFRRDEALDQLDGVIHEVGEENLDFAFDNDRISPRRTRLEGMIFFHGPSNPPPPTLYQVRDHIGGHWSVAEAVMKGEKLQLTTPAGAKVSMSLERIASIDFGSSNVVYLSDLDIERSSWRPYLQFGPVSPLQEQRFGPKIDQSLSGEPLQLSGRVYRKGLALHSRSEIAYRLTEEFTTFRTVAGLDQRMVGKVGGVAELIIKADGDRELFRTDLEVDAPPVPVEIKLDKVRRLTIIVDFGDENDIGDHVILGEARLTK